MRRLVAAIPNPELIWSTYGYLRVPVDDSSGRPKSLMRFLADLRNLALPRDEEQQDESLTVRPLQYVQYVYNWLSAVVRAETDPLAACCCSWYVGQEAPGGSTLSGSRSATHVQEWSHCNHCELFRLTSRGTSTDTRTRCVLVGHRCRSRLPLSDTSYCVVGDLFSGM